MKKFNIRMQGTGGYGGSHFDSIREVKGDFHKISQTGDLSVFRDSNLVTLIVSGQWLEINITEVPEEVEKKPVTKADVEELLTKPIKLGYGNDIDVRTEDEVETDEILNAIRKRRG